jgi:acetyl-CoA acetyltransferase family protein
MINRPVYIIDALRTPMGRANGRLSAFPVSFLSQSVLEGFVHKYNLSQMKIDEVVIGTSVPAGAGQNFVRKALIGAGLPDTTPGYSVGNVCASGLQAVINGQMSILSENAHMVIAAGAESVSHMPEYLFKTQQEIKKIKGLTEGLMHDGLLCSVTDRWMGALCEDMARKEHIFKKEQDDYAFGSYHKAVRAYEQDAFVAETIPLKLTANKVFCRDETLRLNVKREVFDTFQSAFEYKGTITAGNSAAPCDGAAGVLLASLQAVQMNKLQPLARILGCVSIAGHPRDIFQLAPQAVKACAQKAGLSLKEIDLFEISEAFAAQMVFTQRAMPVLEGKLNVFGGDIALGHPLGAAGIRGMVTLVHALKQKKKRYGIICVCLGGGGSLAVCIENEQL